MNIVKAQGSAIAGDQDGAANPINLLHGFAANPKNHAATGIPGFLPLSCICNEFSKSAMPGLWDYR